MMKVAIVLIVILGVQTDVMRLTMHGRGLSAEQAEQLERRLEEDESDLASRTELLGYYMVRSFQNPEDRARRLKHIFWIIENRPESGVAGAPEMSLDRRMDHREYQTARDLWIDHVAASPENPAILRNAAQFLFLQDKDIAEELLEKGATLNPENVDWIKRLAHLYELQTPDAEQGSEMARKAFELRERALELVSADSTQRFYILGDAAYAAWRAGEWAKAVGYGTELLNEADHHRSNWNYGNAVHHGNLVLGLTSLGAGDVEEAKMRLLAGGATPGSPQLNSFGPNMLLAAKLLELGEQEAVLEYFELCSEFWEMHRDKLEQWAAEVREEKIPDFGANLRY